MEPTILQFLIGILVGTAVGLVIVQRQGNNTKIPAKTQARPGPTATRRRTTARPTRNRTARPRTLSRPQSTTQDLSSTPTVVNESIGKTDSESNISACPACGLEAPEALMAEHFMGSPSHKHRTAIERPAEIGGSVPEVSGNIEMEEDPRRSLRNLLQMLVPPRAFGHRHQQKTVNPLSRLIQTLEVSQSAIVHPLKGPL